MRKEEKQKVKEKGKQPQLNAEFQKIAKRDNKAFLNKQCKETEENNRMEKTRTGKDLTEAEEIKRLRQGGRNTQKNNIKKFLMTQITRMV